MGERLFKQTRDEIDRADGARVFHSDRPYDAQAAYDLIAVTVIRGDHGASAQSRQSVFGADADCDGLLLNHLVDALIEDFYETLLLLEYAQQLAYFFDVAEFGFRNNVGSAFDKDLGLGLGCLAHPALTDHNCDLQQAVIQRLLLGQTFVQFRANCDQALATEIGVDVIRGAVQFILGQFFVDPHQTILNQPGS